MAGKAKHVTEHRPSGHLAECPVCDQVVPVVHAHTVEVASGRTVAVDRTNRFADHPNPLHPRYKCVEALDPAADVHLRRAIAAQVGAR